MYERKKFLIISSGRAGSTLCGSILAHAGANFGVENTLNWDEKAGAYEIHEVSRASQHHSLELELKKYSHTSILKMWRRKYHRSMTKRCAAKAFKKADFVKLSNATLARIAKKLGYQPSIIILYRPFSEYTMSSFLRSGRQYNEMRAHFYKTYSTGMVALSIYGGCIITYQEITDKSENKWIDRVSDVTGLDQEKLRQKREEIISKKQSNTARDYHLPDPEIEKLEESIYQLRECIIPPHRLARRSL